MIVLLWLSRAEGIFTTRSRPWLLNFTDLHLSELLAKYDGSVYELSNVRPLFQRPELLYGTNKLLKIVLRLAALLLLELQFLLELKQLRK